MKRGQLVIQKNNVMDNGEDIWPVPLYSGRSESELVLLKAAQMVKCTVGGKEL